MCRGITGDGSGRLRDFLVFVVVGLITTVVSLFLLCLSFLKMVTFCVFLTASPCPSSLTNRINMLALYLILSFAVHFFIILHYD